METKRIFLAINPEAKIKEKLAKAIKEIAQNFPQETKISWARKENLHLTLLFLGPVEDKSLAKLYKTVKETSKDFSPFWLISQKITFGPQGRFPPRLVWLEIEENQQLTKLVARLQGNIIKKGLGQINQRGGKQKFWPHLTLGRIRRNPPTQKLEKKFVAKIEVKSIDIIASQLTQEGSQYTVLSSVLLKSKQ